MLIGPIRAPVVESIWATAKQLQIREFVPRPKYVINDDHVPLRMTGGIPTCDIIDFDYPTGIQHKIFQRIALQSPLV